MLAFLGNSPKFVQKYFNPQKWYSMKSRSFVCLPESPACEAMWVIWRYCPPTLSSLFMFSQGFSIAINVLIFFFAYFGYHWRRVSPKKVQRRVLWSESTIFDENIHLSFVPLFICENESLLIFARPLNPGIKVF